MNIGDRIRIKREELGLSQEELAKRMGYSSRNSIYKYEQMDNMKLSMVQKFADVLGVEPSYLMGWNDETQAKLESIARRGYWNSEISKRMNQLDDSEKMQVVDYMDLLILKHNTQLHR